ncbi:MAG: RluA family pseudouridine synthase [Deltaproteobacteria bacterium]|nr:RluA family pseudouridine synthase [Deltaproteobacteria bacterium]
MTFPSPFDAEPHPLARRAAEELLAELPALGVTEGKMFGVLVAEDAHAQQVTLRAFSGMLGGSWLVPGFAPPLFDPAAWEAMWPAGQASLRGHELALRALDADPARAERREQLAYVRRQADNASTALRELHRARKLARHTAREVGGLDAAALHSLEQQSRADAAERRWFDAAFERELVADEIERLEALMRARTDDEMRRKLHVLILAGVDPERALSYTVTTAGRMVRELAAAVAADDVERAAIERMRADESRRLMKLVHDSYVIASYRGERRALRDLFAPGEPPGGAGDCAGPKLLGEAYRRGLRPIAMAEVWWGPPPATGGRHQGVFYPSCRGKCGPILPHMLDGLEVAGAPVFGARPIAPEEPRTVYEDKHVVVVDKPIDLLSVPGRSGALRDSVQTRLRARYPDATGPLVVHRLDLETSGLLLAAKDEATHTALQAQFARREIEKRYIAWLAGDVKGDRGVIELALRVDLEDRPRQIVDPVHGKPAVTEWSVLAREDGRTRVAFVPRTGRTHQLRVHAAHPAGLGVPIVGDRLYGTAADRLHLHAERIAFVHPTSGQRIELESPAPW